MKIAKYEKAKEWTVDEQIEKIAEEVYELSGEAIIEDKSGILDEGFDVIQAVCTLFHVMGYTEAEIKAHMSLHEQKLEGRHENGTLKISKWMNI